MQELVGAVTYTVRTMYRYCDIPYLKDLSAAFFQSAANIEVCVCVCKKEWGTTRIVVGNDFEVCVCVQCWGVPGAVINILRSHHQSTDLATARTPITTRKLPLSSNQPLHPLPPIIYLPPLCAEVQRRPHVWQRRHEHPAGHPDLPGGRPVGHRERLLR